MFMLAIISVQFLINRLKSLIAQNTVNQSPYPFDSYPVARDTLPVQAVTQSGCMLIPGTRATTARGPHAAAAAGCITGLPVKRNSLLWL